MDFQLALEFPNSQPTSQPAPPFKKNSPPQYSNTEDSVITQRGMEELLLHAIERIQQLEENMARLESDVDCVKSIPVIDYSGEVVSWPDHRDNLYDDDL